MRISDIYLVPLFLSVILSLRSFGQKWAVQYRLFSILLISNLLVEVIARFMTRNFLLYNIYLIPQYLLYMSVFYFELRSTLLKRIILYMGFIFGALGIINLSYFQGLHSFTSYTYVLAITIMIALSILYFYQIVEQKEMVRLSTEPMFWISTAILISHSGNLPLFLVFNHIAPSLLEKLIYILLVMNFIMYSLYAIAFLCRIRQGK
ncbi:MAG: hypothetical protein J0H74_15175 [Chitinophagaceae bacterium]|nr:hypothetical protein [Chitinophagaceae bacterium]